MTYLKGKSGLDLLVSNEKVIKPKNRWASGVIKESLEKYYSCQKVEKITEALRRTGISEGPPDEGKEMLEQLKEKFKMITWRWLLERCAK